MATEMSEKMRKARLVFYEQDIEEINKILADFLERAQAKCALLIDKEGHLAGSWPSKVSPTSKEITGEIEMMLAG